MTLKVEAEVKNDSDPCVAAWDQQLYVGSEDGSIKVYNADLSLGASWAAHGVQLFSLAAGGGRVYSASNDGGVRVWSATGEKISELPNTAGGDVGTIRLLGNEVIIGDENGNVVVYENNEEKARYNLLEEVKDLVFAPPFLFSVRDLDIVVTEIKPDDSRRIFTTRHTMQGRAPLQICARNKLLAMARGGNDLQLFDATVETTFKKLHEVKVSDMIVTSIAVSGEVVWTGGWDGNVRRWKITGDQLETAGDISLGSCVNALVVSDPDNAFAALAGGRIVRIKKY